MIKKNIPIIMFLWLMCCVFSCKKDTFPEPKVLITEFNSTQQAALLNLASRINPDDGARQLYSARYIFEVAGVPYFETSNIEDAMNGSMILISSPIDMGIFTLKEIEALTKWVKNGGVIISPVCKDIALQSIFGFSGAPSYNKSRYEMSWASEPFPELSYFNHINEKTISFGKDNGGNEVIKSYGYSLNSNSKALAHFDSNDVAVIYNPFGQGKAYLFGVEWRDVIQRPQMNRDYEAQRIYTNGFEPSADVFPLFVRSVWTNMQPVSVWKHTIPAGYKTVLMPTHDVDATSGYDKMGAMSDYEKSLGLNALFYITTRYFGDEIANDPYYTTRTIALARAVVQNGHTLGSHSVGHFPDFNEEHLFPMGSFDVNKDNYNPRHVNGVTVNGSTFGELKVSKDLIQANLNVNVRSFRPGHLLTNSFVTQALEKLDYAFHSGYTACDVLTSFPYYERMGYSWGGSLSSVMQIPIHISDNGLTKENYHEFANTWFDVLNSHKDNYSPCVLLIHPTRNWKTDAQKALIDKLNREECGLYNLEDYGDFWKARNDFEFEFDYQEEEQQLVIKASKSDINRATELGIMVQSKLPVKGYRLIDGDFAEYPVHMKIFEENRVLIVIK